jgi:RND family efflux transporter MFP subunit
VNRELVTELLEPPPRPRRPFAPLVAGGAALLGLSLLGLVQLGASRRQAEPLAALPRGVTVTKAVARPFRPERRYVGRVAPWLEAQLGPQVVSAFVDTVRVRPGDPVKRGDVLATLDCRSAAGSNDSVRAQARSIEERQRAMAAEASRLGNLLAGGFVSANELEQKKAQASADLAQLDATRATLRARDVEVADCTLRAPFDGEVAHRLVDPGAFVRPGSPVVTVVDRHQVRVVVDAPEVDFAQLEVGTPVEVGLLATDEKVKATVSRRAPAASDTTRSVEIEVDLPGRGVPTGTTADVRVEVGKPIAAVEIPLLAAKVKDEEAAVFTVDARGVVSQRPVRVLGERRGALFVDGLEPGALVVTQGRNGLADGVVVAATEAAGPESRPR